MSSSVPSRPRKTTSTARKNVRRGASGREPAAPPSHDRLPGRLAAWRQRSIFGHVFTWGGRFAVAGGVAYGLLTGMREGYAYATTSPRFEVRALEFQPTAHLDDDRVRELLALQPGTNILSLSLAELAGRIAEDPWVARASVVRELPDTVRVHVVEHEPVAVLAADGLFLLNAEGEVFKRLDTGERGDLPVVTGIDRTRLLVDPVAGKRDIERALAALAVYREKRRPVLSEVHVDEFGGITMYTAELGTQLELARSDPREALARYDALRVAMGTDTDKLAVAHLDGDSHGEHPERVVASFFPAKEAPSLLVEAQERAAAEAAERAEQHASKPKRSSEQSKRATSRRIPRHH